MALEVSFLDFFSFFGFVFFSFFGFVLSVVEAWGAPEPFPVPWGAAINVQPNASTKAGIVNFFMDLLLRGSYVAVPCVFRMPPKEI